MKFFPQNRPAIIECEADQRPSTTPQIQILDSSGTELVVSGTIADLDPVNTTITTATAAGIQVFTLVTSSNLSPNRRYLVAAGTEQSEVVELDRYVGNSAYLKTPTWYSHISASTFQGIRMSYCLSASLTDVLYDHCVAVFSWSLDSVDQAPKRVDFSISKGNPASCVTPVDLLRIEPDLRKKVASGTDIKAIITQAYEELCDSLTAGGIPVYDLLGSAGLKRAHTYLTLYLLSETYGMEFVEEQQLYWQRYRQAVDTLKAIEPVDRDRDSTVNAVSDVFYTGIRIERA